MGFVDWAGAFNIPASNPFWAQDQRRVDPYKVAEDTLKRSREAGRIPDAQRTGALEKPRNPFVGMNPKPKQAKEPTSPLRGGPAAQIPAKREGAVPLGGAAGAGSTRKPPKEPEPQPKTGLLGPTTISARSGPRLSDGFAEEGGGNAMLLGGRVRLPGVPVGPDPEPFASSMRFEMGARGDNFVDAASESRRDSALAARSSSPAAWAKQREMERASARAAAATQRAAARQAMNARWTQARNKVYTQFQNPNVYRTGMLEGPDQVPFVYSSTKRQFAKRGIKLERGPQAPEYVADKMNVAVPLAPGQGAASMVYGMDAKQLARLRRIGTSPLGAEWGMYDSGFVPLPFATPWDIRAQQALLGLVNESVYTDVSQLMDDLEANGGAMLKGSNSAGGGGGGGGGASGPTNTTQRIFNKTSVDQGKSILRQTMRDMMGREPTDSEVKQYVAALNKKESSTPQVISTTYGGGGSVITQKTLANAPDAGEVLRAQAEEANDEEIAQYEATGFMGVLDGMLGGL